MASKPCGPRSGGPRSGGPRSNSTVVPRGYLVHCGRKGVYCKFLRIRQPCYLPGPRGPEYAHRGVPSSGPKTRPVPVFWTCMVSSGITARSVAGLNEAGRDGAGGRHDEATLHSKRSRGRLGQLGPRHEPAPPWASREEVVEICCDSQSMAALAFRGASSRSSSEPRRPPSEISCGARSVAQGANARTERATLPSASRSSTQSS